MINEFQFIINFPVFSTVLPSNSILILSCRPFVVITTFLTGLVCVEVTSVSWLGQLTEVTSTRIRHVENVVITTKGLQDRNNLLLDGRTMENKGKSILTEIFPSVQNMIFKSIDIKTNLTLLDGVEVILFLFLWIREEIVLLVSWFGKLIRLKPFWITWGGVIYWLTAHVFIG